MDFQNGDSCRGSQHPPQPQLSGDVSHSPVHTYQYHRVSLWPQESTRSVRPGQPTVTNATDESRFEHHVDQVQSLTRSQLQLLNANVACSSPGPPDYPMDLDMASRRSSNASLPPSLCSDSSSWSPACSDSSVQTSSADQHHHRRSTQENSLEREGQEALARANKLMENTMSPVSPFCNIPIDFCYSLGQDAALHYPNGSSFGYHPLLSTQVLDAADGEDVHMTNMSKFRDPFSNIRVQRLNSTYPQRIRASSSIQAQSPACSFRDDNHILPSISTSHSQYLPSHSFTQKKVPPTPRNTSHSPAKFKTFLASELRRRTIADKTIHCIPSVPARALAQSKENARRAQWTREVLLQYPTESAMCESLDPMTMARAVRTNGVFDLSTGVVS